VGASSNIILVGILSLAIGLVVGVALGLRWRRNRQGSPKQRDDLSALRQQLNSAQRMEALGILSGSIMHNLNNLLSVVLGQARLAREDVEVDSPGWRSLGQVIEASEIAAELSREVDSFQSDDDHDRKPIRLQAVVRSTAKLLRDILPDTVNIETDLDPNCGTVLASSTQVQQVIMSLCSNAYHAMFRRHGRITIMMKTLEIATIKEDAKPRPLQPGTYVQLSVADNGRGMDRETLDQIFDPYFSARAPRRGAGLGLTVVKRLLDANEGVAIPSSLPGHGTRFDIFFPLIARKVIQPVDSASPLEIVRPVEVDDATYEAPAVAILPNTSQPRPQSATIMLIEDDAMVAETVQSCLERAGFQVTLFNDGAEALTAFLATPGHFDLLLTDQFMTGLDGREVVSEVRRIRPRIPVILMSGHPEGIQADEVKTLALSGTLSKPFAPSELLNVVHAALGSDLQEKQEKG